MHLIKNKQYRESIRSEQLHFIKKNIRKQLTAFGHSLNSPHSHSHKQFTTLFPDVIDEQSLQFLQTGVFQTQQQEKITSLIEKFEFLMEKRQTLTKEQCIDVQVYGGLLWNFRLLIIFGKDKVEIHTLRDIYCYLKSMIITGIQHLDSQFENLAKESICQRLHQYRHLLTLSFITLLSEYMNQGGSLQPSQHQNWLIDQYNIWNKEIISQLQTMHQLIEQSYQNDSITLLIGIKLQSLRHYLVEQHKIVQVLIYYQPEHLLGFLLEIFSEKRVKILIMLMRNYQFPDYMQLLCGNTIAVVAQLENQAFFKCLIQNGYLDYVKLQLIVRQEYKSYTKKTKLDDNQKCTINIISNFLITLSYMSIGFSDVLWKECICQQIKCAAEEIKHPQIREDFITIVIQCIMYSSSPQKIQSEQNLMTWIIQIIQRRIEEQVNKQPDQMIGSCLNLIRCFFQVGNQQMQAKKLQCNPYHLQFKYLYGYEIFSKSQQCREFLDEFMPDQRENYL